MNRRKKKSAKWAGLCCCRHWARVHSEVLAFSLYPYLISLIFSDLQNVRPKRDFVKYEIVLHKDFAIFGTATKSLGGA